MSILSQTRFQASYQVHAVFHVFVCAQQSALDEQTCQVPACSGNALMHKKGAMTWAMPCRYPKFVPRRWRFHCTPSSLSDLQMHKLPKQDA